MSLDLGDEQSLVRPGSTVSWLPTACLVVRRDSVGDGFDESLRVAEDVDFVWRLVAAGGRVRYDANFEVRHDSRGTLTAWLGRKVYYGTGGALLAQRHGDLIAPAVMSPVFAVATVATAGPTTLVRPGRTGLHDRHGDAHPKVAADGARRHPGGGSTRCARTDARSSHREPS